MGTFIKKLYYWYYRNKRDIPHFHEMRELFKDKKLKPCQRHKLAYNKNMFLLEYIEFGDLQELAHNAGVTRERVRQIIWKWWRTAKGGYDNVFSLEKD